MGEGWARVGELLGGGALGVLATRDTQGGAPHLSLVAVASDASPWELVFATTRASRKFQNLVADPRVSLLVDDRRGEAADFRDAAAATAFGHAVEATGEGRRAAAACLMSQHPGLAEFMASPSSALVTLAVSRWELVRRFQDVLVFEVEQ